jgi:hypothetical protein
MASKGESKTSAQAGRGRRLGGFAADCVNLLPARIGRGYGWLRFSRSLPQNQAGRVDRFGWNWI